MSKTAKRWKRSYPRRRGWYLVRKSDGELAVRSFGQGQWWTDLGRGNGKDGWLGHVTDPGYEWLGYVGDVMKDKPTLEQAKEKAGHTIVAVTPRKRQKGKRNP